MILYVFGVESEDVELLQEGDHLGSSEVAECVAGDAQANWRRFRGRCLQRQRKKLRGCGKRSRDEAGGADEIAA